MSQKKMNYLCNYHEFEYNIPVAMQNKQKLKIIFHIHFNFSGYTNKGDILNANVK